MQNEAPASLAIGTQVSAKYKGAFCEAQVRSVVKQVKCRVTFKHGLGSTTLSDEYVRRAGGGARDEGGAGVLQVGATVLARHPDRQEYLEAVLNKIQDQSQYTVVFDDGDITTLRRNALCMKSGKHFNASESLDNLPLTHPEHFSTPVGTGAGGGPGARRRNKISAAASTPDSDVDYESFSESEDTRGGGGSAGGGGSGQQSAGSSPYISNIGRVVCVENTEKKKSSRETWFPALIVAPSASDTVKIDTKEEFLIRSFKDGRYYTVSKKDTTRFHRDVTKKTENSHTKDAVEKAINFIEKDELPAHWDKEQLFRMADESATESSETDDNGQLEDDDDNDESPEEKDRLVAELYKHMEERGQPINKTPSIGNKDVDLYRLFRLVYRLGGHTRVTNNNLWRQVAIKLGFETTWCINQVRIHYKRYLQSFEELNRTLGCTMRVNPPRSRRPSGVSSGGGGGGRSVIRGKHRSGGAYQSSGKGGLSVVDEGSDKSSVSSQDDKTESPVFTSSERSNSSEGQKRHLEEAVKGTDEDSEDSAGTGVNKKGKHLADRSSIISSSYGLVKVIHFMKGAENKSSSSSSPPSKRSRSCGAASEEQQPQPNSGKMTTRPRRDSTSSLAAAMQVKAQKDNIGDDARRTMIRLDKDKETEKEIKKVQEKPVVVETTAHQQSQGIAPASSQEKPKEVGTNSKKDKGEALAAEKQQLTPPSHGDKREAPAKGEKREASVKGEKREASVKGEKRETSVKGDKREASAKVDKREASAKVDKRETSAKVDKREASAKIDKREASAKADKKEVPAKGDKRETSAKADKRETSTKADKKEAPAKGDKREASAKGGKKKVVKRKVGENEEDDGQQVEEEQHLASNVEVHLGDRLKVFYKLNTIYEAKVIKIQERPDEQWPRYMVHYQGWNARYDEWIKRSKIAENMSWNKGRERQKQGGPETSKAPTTTHPCEDSNGKKDQRAAKKEDKKEAPPSTREKTVTKAKGKTGDTAPTSSSSRSGTPSRSSGSRTNSPALKRQSSRTSVKKESEESDGEDSSSTAEETLGSARKSARLKRTVSGATRSAARKRPPSASTTKDESETEEVDIEKDFAASEASPPPSKAKRGKKSTTPKPQDDGDDRSEEAPEEKRTTPLRAARMAPRERVSTRQSRKGHSSSSKSKSEDEEEDLYAFKEPEPFEEKGDSTKNSKQSGSHQHQALKRLTKELQQPECEKKKGKEAVPATTSTSGATNVRPKVNVRSDSTDSGSDESQKRTRGSQRPPRVAKSSTHQDDTSETAPRSKVPVEAEKNVKAEEVEVPPQEEVVKVENVKEEEAKSKSETIEKESEEAHSEGKGLLHMTKKQSELFPFLSAIKGQGDIVRSSTVPNTRSSSAQQVEETPEVTSTKTTPSKSVEEGVGGNCTKDAAATRTDADVSRKTRSRSQSPPPSRDTTSANGKANPRQKSRKRKTPRKPRSSELVGSESESDLNSEEDGAKKSEAVTGPTITSLPAEVGHPGKKKLEDSSEDDSSSWTKKRRSSNKKEDQQEHDLDLACGETIPGSPMHPSSTATPQVSGTTVGVQEDSRCSGTRLEMPFATVPESVHGPAPQSVSLATTGTASSTSSSNVTSTTIMPASLPPRKAAPTTFSSTSPADDLVDETLDSSSASQSPQETTRPPEGSKSPAESSELDLESVKAGSEDSRQDVEGGDGASGSGVSGSGRRTTVAATRRRVAAGGAAPSAAPSTAPLASSSSSTVPIGKRRRKPREAAIRGSGIVAGGRGSHGKHGSSRFGLETDISEPHPHHDPMFASLESLSHEQFSELVDRMRKTSKHKFLVPFDPNNLGDPKRIAQIQQSMEKIRQRHSELKREVAQMERKKKRARRKERERVEKVEVLEENQNHSERNASSS